MSITIHSPSSLLFISLSIHFIYLSIKVRIILFFFKSMNSSHPSISFQFQFYIVEKHSYKNQIRDIQRCIKRCSGDEEKLSQLKQRLHELEIAVNESVCVDF